MTEIVKKSDSSPDSRDKTGVSKVRTDGSQVKIPSIAARLQAKREKMKDVNSNAPAMKNRVALILDCSGSMSGYGPDAPIELLKRAVETYVNHCDMNDTSVALVPFGHDVSKYKATPLSCDKTLLSIAVQVYSADGSTPMHDGLQEAIGNNSITRAVLVSDGQSNNTEFAYEAAQAYVETKTPVDCVHIGHALSGEEVLKRIAEMTGGIYVKFKDLHTFVQAFKYLTPGFRAMLMSGDAAKLLGSDEVIK